MTDASQVTYDRGQSLSATVQDALRWVTQADIRNYMVAGESLHVSFNRAYNAGARLIYLPPGDYTTVDFLDLNDCVIVGRVPHRRPSEVPMRSTLAAPSAWPAHLA